MPALKDLAKLAVRVDLPHATYTAYDQHARRLTRRVEDLLAQQLTRFEQVAPDERPLLLSGGEREQAEQMLALPLADGVALLRKLAQLTETSIAGVKLTLEPWQLNELRRRAEKNGTPVKDELAKAVKEIQHLVFHGGP